MTKFAFFGTPDFVVYALEEMAARGVMPSVIVTQPDKPAGRGLTLTPPPVKRWAVENSIPVLQPEKLDADAASSLVDFDLFVVAGYGKLIPKKILELPKHGTLNIHPSLLPRFRGPSPIESAILADEREIGVSIILLDEEMDHGPIVAQKPVALGSWPLPVHDLEVLLWRAGGALLAETIPPYMEGALTPQPQDHTRATYTEKMKKEDGEITLSDDAYRNYLKFCAYGEWPGTYFFVEKNGKKMRVKITDAEFAEGEFRVLKVIPEGRREIRYADFLPAHSP